MKKHYNLNFIKTKNFLIQIIIPLIITFSNSNAQCENKSRIYGEVRDSETGNPIEYVTIFLTNTSYGALTDKNGSYVINNIPSGTYNLVCGIIGYAKAVRPVRILKGINQKIDIVLSEKTISTREITVIGESPLEWQKRLRKFTKEFLGEGSNSNDCEILNPEVIDFEIILNTNTLIANAQDAIVIVNNSLGYKIKAYLKDFLWSRSGDDGRFQIYPFFEELNSSDEKEKNNWQVNRINAYKGSFRHFLKSCAEGNVYEEGFRLCKSNVTSKWIYTDRIDSLLRQNKIDVDTLIYPKIKKKSDDEYCMVYDSLLQVVYLGQGEDSNYKDYMKRLTGKDLSPVKSFNPFAYKNQAENILHQSSWFILPAGQLFFNSLGICSDDNPYGKKFAGYWAWKRVADLLPYDYKNFLPNGLSR